MAETVYIKAGSLFDGSGCDVEKKKVILVEEGIIKEILPTESIDVDGSAADIVDLSHCTILPPLVDIFVRLSLSAASEAGVRKEQQQAECKDLDTIIGRNLHYHHSHGVLKLANFDDERGCVARYLDAYQQEVATSICNFSTHRDDESMGADNVVFYSAEFEACYKDGTDLATLGAIVASPANTARQPRGHIALANGLGPIAEAIQSGCRALLQGYGITEEHLQQMAQTGVVWIPNLVSAQQAGKRSRSLQNVIENHYLLLRTAKNMGVDVAVGTGAGNSGIIHGESAIEEIKLLQKAGFSLSESLRCGSRIGAKLLGDESFGLLKKGCPATFLVSRGVSSQLPRKLSYLENIFIRGKPSSAYRKNPVKTVYNR